MGTMMKKTMMGAALAVGLLTAGAAGANAQARGFYGHGYAGPAVRRDFVRPVPRFYGGVGIAVGAPVVDAYVPPCPGDGYVWTAGYYNAGIWIPGAWNFRGGVGFNRGVGYGYRGGFRDNRVAYNHGGFDRGGFDRGFHGRR